MKGYLFWLNEEEIERRKRELGPVAPPIRSRLTVVPDPKSEHAISWYDCRRVAQHLLQAEREQLLCENYETVLPTADVFIRWIGMAGDQRNERRLQFKLGDGEWETAL